MVYIIKQKLESFLDTSIHFFLATFVFIAILDLFFGFDRYKLFIMFFYLIVIVFILLDIYFKYNRSKKGFLEFLGFYGKHINKKVSKKNPKKEKKEVKLEKTLSYKAILIITINSIMGTGIFFLPAVGAKYAGPASLISWGILSIIAIYISMCFAELTSMFPKAGGIYEFSKQAFGRFTSFIIGWISLVVANITMAMLMVGAITYLLPIEEMVWFKITISLFFILGFNIMAYKGMKTSATMLLTFGIITLVTLFSLIVPGLLNFNISNFEPFFVVPIPIIFSTIFFISETFFGWETTTFLAAETKNGEKVIPKVLVIGTLIMAAISLLFVIASLGSIHWEQFGEMAAPLAGLSSIFYGEMGETIFTLLVYISIIGSVAGWVVAAPRLILSMAEDKLFLRQFDVIHPKNKTPYKAIMLQTIITMILIIIGAGSYNTLLHLLVPLVLVIYSAVLISVPILRYKFPNKKRHFKVPFGKIGPIIIALLSFSLIWVWANEISGALKVLKLGGSFILVGLPLYMLLEMYYDKRVIVKVNNNLARLTYWLERFILPVSIRKEIIKLMGNVKGKVVLEYGSSVGMLTMHLAEEVGSKGKIYATDPSEQSLKILKKRADKKGHNHVQTLLQEIGTIHKDVENVDVVVSAGAIASVQNIEFVLNELRKKVKKNCRIVFVDYDKFFKIIPNVEWLNKDKTIKNIFKRSGFDVNVVRKNGIAWQYVFIYGKLTKN